MQKKPMTVWLVLCLLLTTAGTPGLAADEAWRQNPGYDALLWYRASAEMRAIYHEVYNMAEVYVRQQAAGRPPHTWGVVLDIDETAVDNSQNALERMKTGTSFNSQVWADWKKREQAPPLPGVQRLAGLVHELGGYVSFVSNGDSSLQKYYEDDLAKYGIYFDQVLLTPAGTTNSDKNARFQAIVSGQPPSNLPAHEVIAYFGDNIQDFPGTRQKEMIAIDAQDDGLWSKFGNGWFILPNPVYGSWQGNVMP